MSSVSISIRRTPGERDRLTADVLYHYANGAGMQCQSVATVIVSAEPGDVRLGTAAALRAVLALLDGE
jgi:hypothetical protein